LICPVTDCTFERPSYNENAMGYFLTRSLMYLFWDLYCSPADRTGPRASPLAANLKVYPPAFVVTCDFDPLRDEGIAYAEALGAAGVPVEQLKARGHFHASFTNSVIFSVAEMLIMPTRRVGSSLPAD
jgi:acetyl esterase/lipase